MTGPWSITEAREAANLASAQQKGAEAVLRDAHAALADADRAYRQALAMTITELRAQGHPATVCQDLAKGTQRVSDLKYKRDVAEGVRDAAQQACYRHGADRKDVGRFIEWSRGREFAENGSWSEAA